MIVPFKRDITWRTLLLILLVAALYVPAARLGLLLSLVQHNVTLLWPPTGIAIAALVLGGLRLWPGVALGAFLASYGTGAPLAFVLAATVGNTLEALLGAHLLVRLAGPRPAMDRVVQVSVLTGLSAGMAAMVSATVGALGLWLAGMAPPADLPALWWLWWLGDAMGALILLPAILAWAWPQEGRERPPLSVEGVLLLAGLLAVSLVVYAGALGISFAGPVTYAAFPFVIWAALRLGPRGATSATLVTAAVAAWGIAQGRGPFLHADVQVSLVYLHGFLAALALTGMYLAAISSEHQKALDGLRQLSQELEGRVAARTAELEETVGLLREEVQARKQALAEVHQLSGLLPICAHCKKIRNDAGYWERIDRYLASHSAAHFSHGICPDCMRELYPEVADPEPD